MMKILLVSGFLGAGKTTFIKELIRQSGLQPVILENEYGENNLDSRQLQQSVSSGEDLKVLEFMEGCVCCTMKDSFVNSVFTIFSSLSPEYLVIEPTGVGKLSNILNNLKPLTGEVISVLRPIVVISPENYHHNMTEWPVLYRDQIEHAGIVVFSKCEQTPADILAQVTEEVRKINPTAEIVSEHYSRKEKTWWDGLMKTGRRNIPLQQATEEETECFMQVSIPDITLQNPAELILFLEDCLHGVFGHVARAKGTVYIREEILRFDLAEGRYILSGSPDDICQCVVIGQMLDEKKIRERLRYKARSDRFKLRMEKADKVHETVFL